MTMKINTLKKLTLIVKTLAVFGFVFFSTQAAYSQTCNDIVGPGAKVINDSIMLDIQSGTNDTTCFTFATPFDLAADSLVVITGAQYMGDTVYFVDDTCLVYETALTTISRRDTLEIRLIDSAAVANNCDTIIVLTTVHGINDTINDTIVEDSLYTICDTNIIGATADSIIVVQAPTNGDTNVTGGCVDYIPNLNYYGNDTLVVVACKDGLCDTAYVYLTIDAVNDTIIVNNDTTNTTEETPLVIFPLVNDNDTADFGFVDTSSLVVLDSGTNGTVTLIDLVAGTITYSPNTNFFGLDSITYQLCDTGYPAPVTCDSAKIYITVDPINDTVVVNNDTVNTNEDTPLIIFPFANDNDTADFAAIDSSSVEVLDSGSNGTVTIIDPVAGTFVYAPNINFFGQDSIIYAVCDTGTPAPATCDTATIYITVDPVNDPIIANNDMVTMDEDTTNYIIDALTNDNDTADMAVVDSTSTDTITGGAPQNGSVVVNGDGTFTYTPNTNFFGQDSIIYAVCDTGTPTPVTCDTATIYITVNPVNDTIIVNNDTVNTTEDNPLVIFPFINDNDTTDLAAIDSSSVQVLDSGSNGIVTLIDPVAGTISYTPNTNFFGQDSIIYSVCDTGTPAPATCDTATIYITVDPVNDPIIVNNDTVSMPEDTTNYIIDALTNDNDTADMAVVDSTSTDTITGGAPQNGSVVVNGDGTFTYTPNTNFFGQDSIIYAVCDTGTPTPVTCDTATIYITVNPVNDTIIVNNNTVNTTEDNPLVIFPFINDNDTADFAAIDSSSVQVLDSGSNGIVTLIDPVAGTISYTPNTNFFGQDSIIYAVCDTGTPAPATCDTATIYITVDPVNDPIIVSNDSVTMPEDTTNYIINAIANDSDTIDMSIVDSTSIDTITGGAPQNGSIIVNNDGTITYTPNPNFYGQDSIIYTVCDTGVPAPPTCDTATIYITVTPVNDPIIVNNDTTTTSEDTQVVIDPLANDNDSTDFSIVDSTSVSVLDSGSNGTVTAIDPNTGTITYQPDSNYIGFDSIVYAVCDTGIPTPVTCDTATIYITVTSVTDTLPLTVILEDSSLTLCDTSLNGITADSTQSCGANNGIVTAGGSCLTYTPTLGYTGNDTACMIVCNDGICDTTIVPIFIDPKPIIACTDTTLFVDASGQLTIDTSFVLDSVSDNNIDSVWLSQTDFDCLAIGVPTTVTIYAMDSLGQIDSCSSNLTVIDTVAPAVSCQNITIQLDASGNVTIVAGDVDNGTTDNCQIQTLILSQSTFDCSMLGDNNVTLVATDIYGNVDSCTAIVTVEDVTAPVLTCPGDQQEEVSITCSYTIPDYSNLFSATDNCDDNLITYTQTPVSGTVVDADDQIVPITVTAEDTSGNISSCVFNLQLTCRKGVVIYDALTPNGDGDNETFIIDGIEEFPNATIKIINRWGNVVYESENGYLNDWDGTSNAELTIGNNELPTGTYFYILDLNDDTFEGEQTYKGYVYLQR